MNGWLAGDSTAKKKSNVISLRIAATSLLHGGCQNHYIMSLLEEGADTWNDQGLYVTNAREFSPTDDEPVNMS